MDTNTKKKGIVKGAVASTISQRPGPVAEVANIAKVGATGLAKKAVNSVSPAVADLAGTAVSHVLNVGGANDNREKAKQYGNITKKLQKARMVPSSVLYSSNEKDPAFRAKVQGMSAMDDYKKLQGK